MVFEILTFDFYLEEEREIKIISLCPTQYCALLLNLFVILRQSDSSVDGKNGELLI